MLRLVGLCLLAEQGRGATPCVDGGLPVGGYTVLKTLELSSVLLSHGVCPFVWLLQEQ